MDFLHSKQVPEMRSKEQIFIATFQVVHRDLALRNILLTAALIVKIADFGLSRQTKDGAYLRNTEPDLPFRWSAPVALTSKRTTLNADLWTYGVLLWELFKLTAVPYQGKTQADMLAFLNAGKRLDHPEFAPKEM
jgi:serine/threonine protein kinase